MIPAVYLILVIILAFALGIVFSYVFFGAYTLFDAKRRKREVSDLHNRIYQMQNEFEHYKKSTQRKYECAQSNIQCQKKRINSQEQTIQYLRSQVSINKRKH